MSTNTSPLPGSLALDAELSTDATAISLDDCASAARHDDDDDDLDSKQRAAKAFDARLAVLASKKPVFKHTPLCPDQAKSVAEDILYRLKQLRHEAAQKLEAGAEEVDLFDEAALLTKFLITTLYPLTQPAPVQRSKIKTSAVAMEVENWLQAVVSRPTRSLLTASAALKLLTIMSRVLGVDDAHVDWMTTQGRLIYALTQDAQWSSFGPVVSIEIKGDSSTETPPFTGLEPLSCFAQAWEAQANAILSRIQLVEIEGGSPDLYDTLSPASLARRVSKSGLLLYTRKHAYYWNGLRWVQFSEFKACAMVICLDIADRVRDYISTRISQMEQALVDDKKIQQASLRMRKALGYFQSDAAISRLGNLIRAANPRDWTIPVNQLDSAVDFLTVQNGELNLKTGEFLRPNRRHFATKVAGCAYDPNAQCPLFERMIAQQLPDPSQRAFLQHWAAAALLGRPGLSRTALIMQHRAGSGGKTVLATTLLKAFGEYGITSKSNVWCRSGRAVDRTGAEATSHLAALRGARLVLTDELDRGSAWRADLFKTVVGGLDGHTISVRDLHESEAPMPVTFSLMFSSNYVPSAEHDSAIIDRLAALNFKSRFVRKEDIELERRRNPNVPVFLRDENLPKKIHAYELPGVLNWILAGLPGVLADKAALDLPDESKELKQAASEMLGSVEHFARAALRVVPVNTPAARCIRRSDLHRLWVRYWEIRLGCAPTVYEKNGSAFYDVVATALGLNHLKAHPHRPGSYMFVEGVALSEHVFSDIGISPQRDSQHRIQFDDKMLRCDPLDSEQLEVDFEPQPQAASVCQQLAHKALDACKSFGSQLMRLIPRDYTFELKTALPNYAPSASELFEHESQRAVQHALCDQIEATEPLTTVEAATPCAAVESLAAAESLQPSSPATPATQVPRAQSSRHPLRLLAADPHEVRSMRAREFLQGTYPFNIWECIGIKRS